MEWNGVINLRNMPCLPFDNVGDDGGDGGGRGGILRWRVEERYWRCTW